MSSNVLCDDIVVSDREHRPNKFVFSGLPQELAAGSESHRKERKIGYRRQIVLLVCDPGNTLKKKKKKKTPVCVHVCVNIATV